MYVPLREYLFFIFEPRLLLEIITICMDMQYIKYCSQMKKKIPYVRILFHCTTVVVRSNDLIIVETVINYYYTILNTV